MEKLEAGQRIRLDLTETVVETCWAQGKYWTIRLRDGRSFCGRDIDSLIQAGRLELLGAPKVSEVEIDEILREDEEDLGLDEEGDGRWDSPFGEDRED